MGLLLSHTLHFLRPVTTISDKMAAELTRTDERRSVPFQSEMSPIEIDMMIRLTLILEKIG